MEEQMEKQRSLTALKHFWLFPLLLLVATFAFTACDPDGGSGGDGATVTYEIGDNGPSGVGIVFYVSDGGLHGLEVAKVDQSTTTPLSVRGDIPAARHRYAMITARMKKETGFCFRRMS